jgi:hypothetical protein
VHRRFGRRIARCAGPRALALTLCARFLLYSASRRRRTWWPRRPERLRACAAGAGGSAPPEPLRRIQRVQSTRVERSREAR